MNMSLLRTGILGLLVATIAGAAPPPETLLRMDMTKTKGNALDTWINNPAVNKNAQIVLKQDEQGRPFLQSKGWTHYFFPKLFPIHETDVIHVTLRARGKGVIAPGFYVFDRLGTYDGVRTVKARLTKEWKTYDVTIPLTNHPSKRTPWSYPARVRPLIDSYGDNIQFADYAISVSRNPILAEWTIDMTQSTGDVKAKDDVILLPQHMVYAGHQELLNASHGDTAVFHLTLRGRGTIQVGFFAYDLNYNPKRLRDTHCDIVLHTHDIAAPQWKNLTFRVPVSNFRKDGRNFYIKQIRRLFKTTAATGTALELKRIDFDIEKEVIDIPDF